MKGLGRIPDPPDARDYAFRSYVFRESQPVEPEFKLPASGPVLDQGQTPRCVAYSSCHVKLWHEYKQHHRYYNLNADELYARCKELDGEPGIDGTIARVAMQILYDRGVIARPSKSKSGIVILREERFFKIGSYVKLHTLQEIKEAVQYFGPVSFGIEIDEGLNDPDSKGRAPEPTGEGIGGHQMTCFGWSDKKSALWVKNSWGADYGLKGFVWLPYTWLEVYSDWDAWKSLDEPVAT